MHGHMGACGRSHLEGLADEEGEEEVDTGGDGHASRASLKGLKAARKSRHQMLGLFGPDGSRIHHQLWQVQKLAPPSITWIGSEPSGDNTCNVCPTPEAFPLSNTFSECAVGVSAGCRVMRSGELQVGFA